MCSFKCSRMSILERTNDLGTQPLVKLLTRFGGWPVLDSSWDGEDFSWEQLYVKSKMYEMDSLLSISVVPDMKNSNRHIIKVSFVVYHILPQCGFHVL